jgi:tetratricopeptide (TPR) repeat protein
MSEAPLNHPSDEALRALSLGQLAEANLDQVSSHLNDCPECCRRIDQLAAEDRLLARLQQDAARRKQVLVSPAQRRAAVHALRRSREDRSATPPPDPEAAPVLLPATWRVGSCSSLHGMRPVRLREAKGENDPVVWPGSEAMPPRSEMGDRYQLFGEIARGGMGAVLRGRDRDLGRNLAVKVLLERYANLPEAAQRFVEEAQIGGQLQHPGVVPVYDIGRFGDRPFFTMKLVEGQTLAAILSRRLQPTEDRPRLLNIALKVAEALAYAHAKGVIHRDLKPSNIMVGAFGEVQVMDWGLAKVLPEDDGGNEEKAARQDQPEEETMIRTGRSSGSTGGFDRDTKVGSILGTPAYMPPEQATGDIAHLDRRADVFGLGAILCEILTGQPPYVAELSEEVQRKATNGDLAEAFARLESCGADPALIILTKACLSPQALDRPRDAQAVADGLSAYLNGVQERLQATERERAVAVVRASEESKRRKVQLALAAAVVGLLVGGGAFAFWRNAQLQASRERDARNAEAVAALLGKCEEALRAEDAAKAAVALEAAKKRSAEGGAQEQADRLGRLDADLALLRDLDALDQFRWSVVEGKLQSPAVVATRMREALGRFGAEPDVVSVEEAAARVTASVVRERIVSALDRLLRAEKRDGMRVLLRRVDPDPYRDAVRTAVLANDQAKFLELVGQKAALEQPPGFVAFLGEHGAIPVPRWRELLQAAVRQRPGDMALLITLGQTYAINQKMADEGRWWLQAAVAAAPANATAHNNLGSALLEKGQVEEAIGCYHKATALDPKHAPAHYNLAMALAGKGQADEAISSYQKAIYLDPKNPLLYSNLGNALFHKGQVDEAIARWRKAIDLNPKHTLDHYSLGNALYGKGQLDEAIECYRKAIALDPNLAKAHIGLGLALKDKGQVDEAIACFRKAIELDPKLAQAHDTLGVVLADKGQVDEAIACYQRAINVDPTYASAHSNLGLILCDIKGDYDRAITCFQKAIELDPKFAKAHYNLGVALHGKGQVDEAIACFHKAIDLDPKLPHPHNSLGAMLAGKGQMDEAIACIRKAIELDPKYAPAHLSLGNARRALGQVDEAIACYQKAIDLAPKYADAYNLLGAILCDKKRDYDGAITCFQKAITLDPNLANAHANLGNALAGKGQVDEAIASFQKAIAFDPNIPLAHIGLGAILCQNKGDYDGAIACFHKAIALNPMVAQAHNGLGNALYGKGQLNDAIACFRKAIALEPELAGSYCNLGLALGRKGQVDEAITCFKKAISLEPNYAQARTLLASAERFVASRDKVTAFRNGTYTPAMTSEFLDLARWCQVTKLHHTAARLYTAVFAADPGLADGLKLGHRYRAACQAALAAAGQGGDAATLDEKERTRLRQQALAWLHADLALWAKQLGTGQPIDRGAVQQTLKHWQQDTDLAGLRSATALAKLPAEEQQAWTLLWADVAALLKKAEEKPK